MIILSFLTQMKDQKTIDIPDYYPWWLLLCGLSLGLAVFARRVAKSI